MPEKGHRALLFYGAQTEQGTAVSPTLPCAIYENLRINELANVEAVNSSGSDTFVELEEGMSGVELGFDIPKVQGAAAKTFLQRAMRTGTPKVLPWETMGYGYVTEDGVSEVKNQVQDCRIDTLELSGGTDKWLSGSVGLFGGKISEYGAMADEQTFVNSPGFAMHEAVFSLFELSSWRVSYANNVEMKPVIAGPATTRDPVRQWDYLLYGGKRCTGNFGLYNDSGFDLSAAVVTQAAPTLTFTNKRNPYNTFVASLNVLKPTNQQLTIPGADSDIEYELPWIAADLVLT